MWRDDSPAPTRFSINAHVSHNEIPFLKGIRFQSVPVQKHLSVLQELLTIKYIFNHHKPQKSKNTIKCTKKTLKYMIPFNLVSTASTVFLCVCVHSAV